MHAISKEIIKEEFYQSFLYTMFNFPCPYPVNNIQGPHHIEKWVYPALQIHYA